MPKSNTKNAPRRGTDNMKQNKSKPAKGADNKNQNYPMNKNSGKKK